MQSISSDNAIPSTDIRVPRKHQSPQDTTDGVQLSSSLLSSAPLPSSSSIGVPTGNGFTSNPPTNGGGGTLASTTAPSLPDGVIIPAGIDSNILYSSERIMSMLMTLNPSQIQAALNEFDEAIRNKGDKVRNVQAYFIGVLKRYVSVNSKEKQGGQKAMGANVAPSVSTILQNMISSGFCTQSDLNEKVMAKVQMLSEQEAIMALNELSSVPRETIRNFPSYMMGILNRYMRGESGANAQKQGQNRQQQHSRGSRPDRSRHSGDRYGRRSSRSNSPGDRRNRHRRHRSRSPSSDRDYHRRSRRDRSRSRSRSRDRYDDRSRDRRRRSRSPSPRYRRDDRYDHDSRRGSQSMNVNPSGTNMVQQFGIPPPPPPQFAPQQHIQPSHIPHIQPQSMMQMHQQQQPIWNNLGGQAPPAQSFNAPSSAPSYSSNPSSQVTGLPVIDILGIAERAAAAIGSMSGNTAPMNSSTDPRDPRTQVSTSVDPRQNISQNVYTPQNISVQPQNTSNQRKERYSDSRDDVKLSDLSPMLQYSVSNLVSTGHLDSNPGGNVCRFLKSLPEPLALGCLEKFSGIDSSTMRSKEGYLVGILKKAQANGRVV